MTLEHHLQKLIEAAVQEALERHLPRLVERLTLPPDPDLLRTYEETAEYLSVSVDTVREMVKRRDLYTVGKGAWKRIPHRAIQRMYARAEARAKVQPGIATNGTDPKIAKRLGLKSKSSPRQRGTA